MKRKIFQSMCLLAIFAIVLTALVLGAFFSGELYQSMKQQLRSEAVYLAEAIDSGGLRYLQQVSAANADTRITLIAADGTVLFDNSLQDEQLAENHNERPEVVAARKFGSGEAVRDSATVGQQTFYYAVKLDDGKILRLAKTTDSVFHTLMGSLIWLGLLMIVIILIEIILVQRQTKKLIRPINSLDLEHPLDNVCYEELKPLLTRVDQQNLQIACQLEELKKTEAVRREFSANVSHELKTPLMSISG